MPPPVDFPRELFADALTEHARLVEVHADAILTAPLEERRVRDGDDEDGDDEEDDEKEREDHPSCRTLGAIDLTCSVLASDGALHELHKWRTQEVSFVVQRCHGIVRRLMQDPDDGFTYVVVVARGVASLQLLRGVEPKRGGDRERLEVAERDLAVEPWDQWHRRSGGTVTTWWRTPLGELVASRVVVPPRPRTKTDVVDALVALYEPSVRRGLTQYVREYKRRGLAIVETSRSGETLHFVDRLEGSSWLDGFPATVGAVDKHHPGFDPVIVDAHQFAGLRWLASEQGRDQAVPKGLVEELAKDDDDHG
jgi:hypothetical protein